MRARARRPRPAGLPLVGQATSPVSPETDMINHSHPNAASDLPFVELLTARVHDRDEKLWALLTKPGLLTREEWAYLEEVEARTS
jgi:hypothetical protein